MTSNSGSSNTVNYNSIFTNSAINQNFGFDNDENLDSDKNDEDKLFEIKKFCQLLNRNQDLHVLQFYEFFEIPEIFRTSLRSHRATEILVTDELESQAMSFTGKQTLNFCSVDQEKPNLEDDKNNSNKGEEHHNDEQGGLSKENLIKKYEENHQWVDFTSEETRNYCTYFFVRLQNIDKIEDSYYEFTFQISAIFGQIIKFNITKRYSNFKNLASELKKFSNSRPPALPKQLIFNKDQEKMEVRGRYLRSWLEIVANEKMFQVSPLFKFLKIRPSTAIKLQQYQPISFLYSELDFKIQVSGYETLKIKESKHFVTLYSLNIDVINKGLQNLVTGYCVQRRFNEFVLLDSKLKIKFGKYRLKLPEIPSKLQMMNSQTSKETRQLELQNYLESILSYPDIFDTIVFRKFIKFDSKRFQEFNIEKSGVGLIDI